ncbi:MAG: hypothetical protein HYZ57_09180 [Acidobacteria bacterium]|nr:hypothetical protein [Acidobacteriota bacterium]
MKRKCLIALFAWVAAGLAADCSRTSVGFTPLNGPFFRPYRGFEGGLYPGGSNQRPAAHEAAGVALAREVVPRDAAGGADAQNGHIVLLSIGMSNTTQEFSAFLPLAIRDVEKNPRVLPVDGAFGGWSADRILEDPGTYLGRVEQRLQQAGATSAQVQVAWVKLADRQPSLSFPEDARKLQGETKSIVRMLRERFPNLKLAYLSSRIYAGYASSTLNPEPYAYQSGFAVKWLIEQQIRGDPELSFREGKAPWLAWGPYSWADGTRRRPDGLTWECSDLGPDGTHPSVPGRQKVARMLLDFFKADSTARIWFVRDRGPSRAAAIHAVVNAASYAPAVMGGAIASIFGSDLAARTAAAPAVPLPYGLAGTTVEVGAEPAPLYFVSPGQINFIVPPGANGSEVIVHGEGAESNRFAVQFNLFSEGLFTTDGRAAAALHADGTPVAAASPAKRGETIMLFGTGRGVRNPMILAPEVMPRVRVGGREAEVKYWGEAPGWPGLDQINIAVPADAPAGAGIDVVFETGSNSSNRVTIAIA